MELLVLVFELSLVDLYKKFCPSVTSEIMSKVMDRCVVFRFRESWICEQNWSIINVGGCSEVNIGLQRSYPTSGSHVPKMSCLPFLCYGNHTCCTRSLPSNLLQPMKV